MVAEYLGYAGMALSLVALGWVVLSGHSGLARRTRPWRCLALRRFSVSGASITVSLLYCKRLHDHGVSAEVVTSVRYVAADPGRGAGRAAQGGLGRHRHARRGRDAYGCSPRS